MFYLLLVLSLKTDYNILIRGLLTHKNKLMPKTFSQNKDYVVRTILL